MNGLPIHPTAIMIRKLINDCLSQILDQEHLELYTFLEIAGVSTDVFNGEVLWWVNEEGEDITVYDKRVLIDYEIIYTCYGAPISFELKDEDEEEDE